LFPVLLITPVALAIVWGEDFSCQQLYIKVNTDLSVSHDVYSRIRKQYQNHLQLLVESFIFRSALEADNEVQLRKLTGKLKARSNFSYLHLFDPQGQYRATNQIKNVRSSLLLLNAFGIVKLNAVSEWVNLFISFYCLKIKYYK